MSFDIIFCMDAKRGIGKNNQIPWNVKEDMLFFKKMTLSKTIIMGHKTWISLPFRPLKERNNIVISSQYEGEKDGAFWCKSFSDAYIKATSFENDIMMIGGKRLLDEAIVHPSARHIYLTELQATFDCDTFLEPLDETLWKLGEVLKTGTDEKSGVSYTIRRYDKI